MQTELLFSAFPHIAHGDLALRQVSPPDAPALFKLYGDPELFRYRPGVAKKNLATVENMVGHFARDFGKRKTCFLGIYAGEDLVGLLEIFDLDARCDLLTFGYTLLRRHWGHGYATLATALIVDYLFRIIQVNRIQAFVMPENEKSLAVLERNGFSREGLLRQSQFWTGHGLVDLVVFARLRAEYQGSPLLTEPVRWITPGG